MITATQFLHWKNSFRCYEGTVSKVCVNSVRRLHFAVSLYTPREREKKKKTQHLENSTFNARLVWVPRCIEVFFSQNLEKGSKNTLIIHRGVCANANFFLQKLDYFGTSHKSLIAPSINTHWGCPQNRRSAQCPTTVSTGARRSVDWGQTEWFYPSAIS